MAEEQSIVSESEKKKEDWMNSKWRPMMGWMYMLVCTMDFVGFPILWSLLQAMSHGQVNSQWQPLTLQGAGLFHIAMGAIIGVSAYGRTQEKLNGANNGGIQMPANAGTTYTPPPPIPQAPTPVNVTVDVVPPAPVAATPAPVAATPAPVVDPDTQPHPDPTVDPTRPLRRAK